jgi:hypothetical protein
MPDRVLILEDQVGFVEQHVDERGDFSIAPSVNGRKNPRSLSQHENRNPCSTCDEALGREHLLGVVARYESNQNVGVDRRHFDPGNERF